MSDAESSPSTEASPGDHPGRILALADAVVAIAMTLLALDLKPDLPSSASSIRLAHFLGHHAGQYGAFAIAFALIAQYWVTHHRMMRRVRRVSPRLMSETLLFLFAITLMPLSTFLTGTYDNALAVTIFAANIFLVSFALSLVEETIHRARLDDRPENDQERLRRRARSLVTLLIPGAVAGLAWVWGGHAAFLYLLFYFIDYPGRWAARRRSS